GDPVEHPGPLAREHPRPRTFLEGLASHGHRTIDVGLFACRGLEIGLVRHGVEDAEGAAVDAVDELPTDEVLNALGQILRYVLNAHARFPPAMVSAPVTGDR